VANLTKTYLSIGNSEGSNSEEPVISIPNQEYRKMLARSSDQSLSITTTISLKSSSKVTQNALIDWLDDNKIPATLANGKLTVALASEDESYKLLNKLYGYGSFDDALQLQRNLSRRGWAANYQYYGIASPQVEGKLHSQGSFSIVSLSRDSSYPFETGTAPAARYVVNVKDHAIAVVIPIDGKDQNSYLKTLKDLFDRTSPNALKEIQVIRVEKKSGPEFTYKSEETGQVVHAKAAASAETSKGVMTFYGGKIDKLVYFHELGHMVADEFFRYFQGKGNPYATGLTSNLADPWKIWDYALRDRRNVIDHGNGNPRVEDFANSIEQWVSDPMRFTVAYPKRGDLIDQFVASNMFIDRRHPEMNIGLGNKRNEVMKIAEIVSQLIPSTLRFLDLNASNYTATFLDRDLNNLKIKVHTGWEAVRKTQLEVSSALTLVSVTKDNLPNFWSVRAIDTSAGLSKVNVEIIGSGDNHKLEVNLLQKGWEEMLKEKIKGLNLKSIPEG
jgi:hypothetical protein